MGLNDISCSLGQGVGKLVGGTRRALSWPGNTFKQAKEKLRFVSPDARVRTIVTEELIRLIGQEELVDAKFAQRLQVMAETILALQERLDELTIQGRISEADVLDTMNTLKAADSLSNDERIVLANVFRQNIALQKPELVETAVGQA